MQPLEKSAKVVLDMVGAASYLDFVNGLLGISGPAYQLKRGC